MRTQVPEKKLVLDLVLDGLDTYMAEYGDHQILPQEIKIYVEGGLGVPEELRDMFPRRYICDPWKRTKYSEWKFDENGLFQARVEGSESEWVVYDDKWTGRELPRYEYVGGCWFVFKGVKYWKYCVEKENSESVLMSSSDSETPITVTKGAEESYTLHGALTVSPDSGWISWVISAQKFHVEI